MRETTEPTRKDFYHNPISTRPFSGQVVAVARPFPVLRFLYQAALHRIAVNISHFLDPLPVREDIEVVVARLPEG